MPDVKAVVTACAVTQVPHNQRGALGLGRGYGSDPRTSWVAVSALDNSCLRKKNGWVLVDGSALGLGPLIEPIDPEFSNVWPGKPGLLVGLFLPLKQLCMSHRG